VLYGRACVLWETDGPDAAESPLRQAIELDPEHADAHYALAALAEERDDAETMIAHHLQVLLLDARQDREAGLGTRTQLDAIEAVAREVLEGLPSPFKEKLEHVPVVLDRRPSRDLVEDGFDPRALGLFEGPTHGDRGSPAPSPTRIVLFVNNLLADFPEGDELSEQVEITLLHEIGHYFDLDEDDMVRLGLD
jgi:predicted Zn-dependent protease with MMP-like domain